MKHTKITALKALVKNLKSGSIEYDWGNSGSCN